MNVRLALNRNPCLVWIAGYPKSGNTWLRLFLKAYLGDGTVDINDYTKGPAQVADVTHAIYEAVSPVPIEQLQENECFYLRPAALYKLAQPKANVLVKTHCANTSVQGIELIPKELTSGAIYLVRDPRDVCISYAHHMGTSIDAAIERMNNVLNMARYYPPMQHLSTWSDNVRTWAEEKSFPRIIMRYEDMLEDPKDCFAHAARFITGKVDEDHLEKSVEAVTFEKLRAQEKKHGFKERSPKADVFFRKGGSTWKEVLTKEQRETIEKNHGETMQKLGYEL